MRRRYYFGIVTDALIDFWIDSTKCEYETLKESNSLFEMQDALRNLSYKLAMFRTEIFVSAKDRASEIVKAKGISIQETYSSLEEMRLAVFPRLGEAVELVKEIAKNLNDLFERFFTVAEINVDRFYTNSLERVEKVENCINKNKLNMTELDELINEVNGFEIGLVTVIRENQITGIMLWDHFRTFLHAGDDSGNEITDKFPRDYKFKIGDIELNLLSLREKENVADKYIEKKRDLGERIGELTGRIMTLKTSAQSHSTILEVISKLDPEFPINLQRLSELVKMDNKKTEKALEYIIQLYPQIGKYDSMSQMLVFDKPDKIKKKTKKPKKKVKCPDCDSEIKSTLNNCPNCGKEFDICSICRGIITTEKTKSCSSCGRIFHKNHLKEWMNTNSNCPVCKDKL